MSNINLSTINQNAMISTMKYSSNQTSPRVHIEFGRPAKTSR